VTSTPVRVAVVVAAATAVAATAARAALGVQAHRARRTIGKPLGEEAHVADGVYKKKYGDPLHLLVLGDSIAAGLGAAHHTETLGAQLARRTAKRTRRSVVLRSEAVVGAETSMLHAQLAALPPTYRPDVAVVVVGGNDVIHRVPPATSLAHLGAAIRVLQERGARVVVGTCPDLGALTAVPQPLRALGSLASRQLAAAQHGEAERLGAVPVSLATLVGPFFLARPDEMFAEDRFHPSGAGYRRTAKALLPAVLDAVDHQPAPQLAAAQLFLGAFAMVSSTTEFIRDPFGQPS